MKLVQRSPGEAELLQAALDCWRAHEADLRAKLTDKLGPNFQAVAIADRGRAFIVAVRDKELQDIEDATEDVLCMLACDTLLVNDYLDFLHFPDHVPDELDYGLLQRLELADFWQSWYPNVPLEHELTWNGQEVTVLYLEEVVEEDLRGPMGPATPGGRLETRF